MSSECSISHSQPSSSSSSVSTIIEARPPLSTSANYGTDITLDSSASSPSSQHRTPLDKQGYSSPAYETKGKRRASHDETATPPSDDVHRLSGEPKDLPVRAVRAATSSPLSSREKSPSSPPESSSRQEETATTSRTPLTSSQQRRDREQRTRPQRGGASRSVAPSPLRAALNTSPTTCSGSQFVSLLGQPVAVSASISAPNKNSVAATSAALPSLYKASRGRSTNVSPSRRWDRRGASASVLSGASASGSGGEGDEPSDDDIGTGRAAFRSHNLNRRAEAASRSSVRRLSVSKEEALFPSDDDDSPPLSPCRDAGDKLGQHRRRSRRWSSIERERSRGMRILLQEHSNSLPVSVHARKILRSKSSRRGRTRSANRIISATEEDPSDVESSSLPSSCSSSCDLNYVPTGSDTAAIPIKDRRSCSTGRPEDAPNVSVSAASSQGQVPSSTDGSDDPSPAASTPSTSLIQKSPPGFTALKSTVAIPVASEADPLLGLATPSVEDLIQIDKVEFFPEETITAQLASAQVKRKTSPKRSKKSSWIIGDFESEPESDEEQKPARASLDSALNRGHATAVSTSPPSPSAGSYQARLASLQSQLRIWSRTPEAPSPPRTRQITSGSEDQANADAESKDADSSTSSLLSASWRNLTRLPNLILLPGLAARQARESLTLASKAQNGGLTSGEDRASPPPSEDDFAHIYRLANSTQGSLDEAIIQAQRDVALKTGRPPSPSPPASLLGSRRSSNDSVSTIDRAQGAPRRGRGVASPLEADRDPSAYVSGLGRPIDPDTELSSVVQLQTFRSRSRSRPADVRHRSRVSEDSRSDSSRHRAQRDEPRGPPSPKKLGQPMELAPTEEEGKQTSATKFGLISTRPSASADGSPGPLTVQIPTLNAVTSTTKSNPNRQGLFAGGPVPTDTASAPTSPTFREETSSSTSSADETDSIPSPPLHSGNKEGATVDAEGFRVVRRRHRRKSSGPRSLRPKVEALVPQGFSAFAIEEGDKIVEGSESDGDKTPSPLQARRSRGRHGRDTSPRRSTRQCAVGLFGGGFSAAPPSSLLESSSRLRRSGRKESSNMIISSPIRSVRSSPDLTYAAAAAAPSADRDGDTEGQDQSQDDPSPPRGSRGRRGAVKVVASSVGQQASLPQPLLLGGFEGLRRGPSYPPRAGEMFEDGSGSCDGSDYDPLSAGSAQPLRIRLLSNSSHLLMLSLELDMIKKQKISAPLKPRWGKHRANDFNPLPSTISWSSSAALSASSKLLRSPVAASDGNDEDAEAAQCEPCDSVEDGTVLPPATASKRSRRAAAVATVGGSLRDPSSRLRYSWSLADIASPLDAVPARQ